MKVFKTHQGIVAPLDRANVDTDAIIPKQYLKSVKRSGFGPNLFDDWRYLEPGEPGQDHSKRKINADFILNQPRYRNASILLARENFGCGSSREHAVWSLMDAGFMVVIAPMFADIFFSNAFKNGLLAVVLSSAAVDILFARAAKTEHYGLMVNLPEQILSDGETVWKFEVDAFNKRCLLEGLDEIGLTLEHSDRIREYEDARRKVTPWLFNNNPG